MSYDLVLWRSACPLNDEASRIYHRLCDGDDVEELVALPIGDIKQQFAELFNHVEDAEFELNWETDGGGMQVNWGVHPVKHVHVALHGAADREARRIVHLAHEFGCTVYDPQCDQTYEPGG